MKEHYLAVIKFPMLVSLSLIILSIVFFSLALSNYHHLGLSAMQTVLFTFMFIVLTVLVSTWILILMSTHQKIKPHSLRLYTTWMLFNIYFYLAKWLGKVFMVKKSTLQESFLNFNNEIILSNFMGIHSKNILLLLPHCLQNSECKIRITSDVIECAECGKCDIAKVKGVVDKYQVNAAVATGGSLARKLIKDNRPDVIIAVACHRDLTDGVRDSWRFPVYAVLNERPNGPCFETTVSVSTIEFAIKKFI
ncbi:MAG: DUF116 domain-containing protein [Candidatus Cloacimonetes bacterium]|nr:DUF116 domain-containing protein [Candidatus Cloacimonadota bacterium]MDD3235785.1 DUF116 domain-containing protein [Candidatus Cloacimonadota bacterium]